MAALARGGVSAMAVSHPDYYSSMVEWSHARGGAPITIHAAERPWVTLAPALATALQAQVRSQIRRWSSGAARRWRLPGGLISQAS